MASLFRRRASALRSISLFSLMAFASWVSNHEFSKSNSSSLVLSSASSSCTALSSLSMWWMSPVASDMCRLTTSSSSFKRFCWAFSLPIWTSKSSTCSSERHRSSEPSGGAREEEAQAQAPRAVSQLLLHGCKMPRVFQHNHCVQPLSDSCGVRQLPDRALPADRRACPAHRGVLLQAER